MERVDIVFIDEDGNVDEVKVLLTEHAIDRAWERAFSVEEIASMVELALPQILALKPGQKFQIVTDQGLAALVCEVWNDEADYMITVTVITAIRREDGLPVKLKDGIQVIAV